MNALATRAFHPETSDGWSLHLQRTRSPAHHDPSRRPILIVPGYGMNAFIFGYHPRGTSMVKHLAEAGFEVWTANLRFQGDAKPTRRDAGEPSLRTLAAIDVTTAIETTLANTESDAKDVTLVGCSLGGSIAYAHLALVPDTRVGALITIGSPLRWVSVPTLLALPFRSPRLLRFARMSGTRRLAATMLPILAKTPRVLGLYMNAAHVDLSRAVEMAQTVEDAHPRTNQDIARWVNARDMILRGVNVTGALGKQTMPLLVVVGNKDGIVPEATALTVLDAWGGRDVEVIRVGTDDKWYAHADLFIGDAAPTDMFEPIARWLRARP